MALLHTIRRHDRECQLWNIACDIVVNGLIAEDKNYELPPDGIRKPEWETKSVEEIYELLLQGVCVYLTDGYGYFPRDKPSLPVLWIVVPGGLDTDKFPFGEVVKIY